MIEEEWLASADLGSMIDFMQDKGSDRRWRLFAVGCCRRSWQHLHAKTGHRLVEVFERTADGHLLAAEFAEASRNAEEFVESDEGRLTETS